MPSSNLSNRPRILFLGTDILYNPSIYKRLVSQFDIIQPPLKDLRREPFMQHLRDGTWGDFQAIMRPSWHSGNEMERWDRETIELLPKGLKVFASAGAGYDWVDTACLAEHGILYCNGAGASTEAVGDMALHHIISVFRNMNQSAAAARSLDRETFLDAHHHIPATSRNPRNHKLGIIGLGQIGFVVAQKAYMACGMKILYHDIVRKPLDQEQSVQATYFENLDEMLRETDCLVLATPSSFSGRPFLTAEIIALLPRGARFVNIARGSLVDEDALANALEEGHLAAAALDVHAHEPRVCERFVKMENVLLTSHTGGGVVETRDGFERLAMENVERVLLGGEALTPVNKHLMRTKEGSAAVNGHGVVNGNTNGHGHSSATGEEEGVDGSSPA
ncbi:MAG: hypothetical protein LQ350_006575 [Teloschistes chrysophthalmus]|nr:MAG: hypothetical protein LQ350_006575 [Niorma chrysophthalma]